LCLSSNRCQMMDEIGNAVQLSALSVPFFKAWLTVTHLFVTYASTARYAN